MPVYTFTFPAAATGLPYAVTNAAGTQVTTGTLGAPDGTQGPVTLTAALATVDDYTATATDSRIFASFRSPGMLDLEASVAALATTDDVDTLVEQAVQDHTPGVELGQAARTSSITSTATTAAGASALTGLSVTVVGQGRPVDVRFYTAALYHSVANTAVSLIIVKDGNATGTDNQIGTAFSPSTTTGPSVCITRRTATLTDGVSYTFTVRAWGGAAGTTTVVGASFCPAELVVTSR